MKKRIAVFATLSFGAVATAAADCPREWFGFPSSGVRGLSPLGAVYCLASVNHPQRQLCVGGYFRVAGDVVAENMAFWNSAGWTGMDVFPTVSSALDWSGPSETRILVGLDWYPGLQVWDGAQLANFPSGLDGAVHALCVFDDGSGPALYAGGDFWESDDGPAKCIARWDGEHWSPLGAGMYLFTFEPVVRALAVFDDGRGPALYAAGDFMRAGEVDAWNIARWDGSSWSDVGGGLWGGYSGNAYALAVYDDGDGPALYAAGSIDYAGGQPVKGIARWDGNAWSDVGGGLVYWNGSWSGQVKALAVHDDGSGPALYAGGCFAYAGGLDAANIARWDGTQWSPLGSGIDQKIYALASHDAGDGPLLYAGGWFDTAGGLGAKNIARWNGAAWSPLTVAAGMNDYVNRLRALDLGTGPAVYTTGAFEWAGTTCAFGLAHRTDGGWAAIGDVEGAPCDVIAFGPPEARSLYVAGSVIIAQGENMHSLARWDGQSWSDVGGGLDEFGIVYVLLEWDDGTGPALYAAGDFQSVGGVSASRIARWDGTQWSALASGLAPDWQCSDAFVNDMAIFDDGRGPALYATGQFGLAGGAPALNIARWDGFTWSPLGSGLGTNCHDGTGWRLAVFDDGGGPALYVTGYFAVAGGLPINRIARWDGQQWSAVGELPSPYPDYMLGLAVHDDGNGPALYAAEYDAIWRWDGAAWMSLEQSPWGVYDLLSFDDGSGPALWAGGAFVEAGGRVATGITKWACAANWLPGDLNCDGLIDGRDVNPFVLRLSDPDAWETAYPGCPPLNGDLDGGGTVGFDDINPFVAVLAGGGR